MSKRNLQEIEICTKLLQVNLKNMKDNSSKPNVDLIWRRGHAYLREGIDMTSRPWGPIKNQIMYNRALEDFLAAQRIMYS